MRKSKLRHKDRVTIKGHTDKVYTVMLCENHYRLFQVNSAVVFDLEGVCCSIPSRSRFKIGDQLEFLSSDINFRRKINASNA